MNSKSVKLSILFTLILWGGSTADAVLGSVDYGGGDGSEVVTAGCWPKWACDAGKAVGNYVAEGAVSWWNYDGVAREVKASFSDAAQDVTGVFVETAIYGLDDSPTQSTIEEPKSVAELCWDLYAGSIDGSGTCQPSQEYKRGCDQLSGYWDGRVQSCFNNSNDANIVYCQNQNLYQLSGATCGTYEAAVCFQSSVGYYVAAEDRCVASKAEYLADQCASSGKIWYGSCITTLQYQQKLAAEACLINGGYWNAGCYENQEAYNGIQCQDSGKVWYNGCITYAEYEAAVLLKDCQEQKGYWKEGQCYSDENAYKGVLCQDSGKFWFKTTCLGELEYLKATCADGNGIWKAALYPAEEYPCFDNAEAFAAWECAQEGLQYFEGSCMTDEEVQEVVCIRSGGAYVIGDGCYVARDVFELCEEASLIYDAVEDECLVFGDQQVPKGLERFFQVVTEAQYDVLNGDYQFWVDQQLARLSKDYIDLSAYRADEVLALVESAREAAKQATIDAVADMGVFVPTPEVMAELILEETRIIGELAAVEQLMLDRVTSNAYHSTPEPGSSIQIIRSLVTSSWPEVSVSYPLGFPTPVKFEGMYYAEVPVRVNYPALSHPLVGIEYVPEAIYYEASIDGGASWGEGYVDAYELDEDFIVQFDWPANSGKYNLLFRARAVYTEVLSYEGTDLGYEIDSMRAGTMMKRSFYTSSNPFQGQAATAAEPESQTSGSQESGGGFESEAYSSGDEPEQQGSSPSGAAAAYNRGSYENAKAQAKADAVDQDSGLGLGLMFKALPYLAGALALFVAFQKGFLNWVPGVKQLKARAAAKNAPKDDGLSLDLDLESL